jgi:hypothetical protein
MSGNDTSNSLYAPRWVLYCGLSGVICLLLAGAAVLLAVLPSAWVGHPYLHLAERLNPGIDAPDNWAVACVYFFRVVCSFTAVGGFLTMVSLLVFYRFFRLRTAVHGNPAKDA